MRQRPARDVDAPLAVDPLLHAEEAFGPSRVSITLLLGLCRLNLFRRTKGRTTQRSSRSPFLTVHNVRQKERGCPSQAARLTRANETARLLLLAPTHSRAHDERTCSKQEQ